MNNKYFRIFALIFVLGFIFSANLHSQTDNRLNGDWVNFTEGVEQGLKLDNGSFEETIIGLKYRRGTYVTNNGKITIDPTHIHGEGINVLFIGSGISLMDYGIEPKWYTVNEFIITFRSTIIKLGGTEEDANEFTNSFFSQNRASSYSVDGNTLIVLSELMGNTYTVIYNKR